MELVEGIDYYIENGKYVFTEHFLLKRKKCCHSNCRHCPYKSSKGDISQSEGVNVIACVNINIGGIDT
jgi:L-lysine 2,3-aminomutase